MKPFRLCMTLLVFIWVSVAHGWTTATLKPFILSGSIRLRSNTHLRSSPIPSNDDASGGEEGADLAAEFFKMAQSKGIGLDADDLVDDDEDEDEDEDDSEDDEEVNIPQSAVNAFLGYDTGAVGDLAGNVSLTNDQLYSEVKERVLDTAGGFVDFVKAARDDEDDGDDETEEDTTPKPYEPPTTIPDGELTAGEVVLLVLEALRNNDNPNKNKGVEILFGFSSPTSQVKTEAGLTPDEYADFLQETEYKVLLDPAYKATIEKADYSNNGLKAFFTARLTHSISSRAVVNVNFILSSCTTPSSTGTGDDSCWLVDSILIRPESMRRRRRR